MVAKNGGKRIYWQNGPDYFEYTMWAKHLVQITLPRTIKDIKDFLFSSLRKIVTFNRD